MVTSKYYEPIISEELWWKSYNSFRTLKRIHQKQFEYRYSHYELSSVLKCAHCGTSYVHSYRKDSKKVHSYYTATHCTKGCPQVRKGFQVNILEPLFHGLYYLNFLWNDDIEKYLKTIEYEFNVDNSELNDERG